MDGTKSEPTASVVGLQKKLVLAPTTKAVGYMDVTKSEPTASVVGLQKTEVKQTFETPASGNTGTVVHNSKITYNQHGQHGENFNFAGSKRYEAA